MRFVFIKGMLYVVFARIDRYLFRLVSRFIIHALPCLTLLVQSRLPFSNTTQHNTTNAPQLPSFMTLKGHKQAINRQTDNNSPPVPPDSSIHDPSNSHSVIQHQHQDRIPSSTLKWSSCPSQSVSPGPVAEPRNAAAPTTPNITVYVRSTCPRRWTNDEPSMIHTYMHTPSCPSIQSQEGKEFPLSSS